MKKEPQVVEAFAVLCDMALALGVKPLNEHEGCWEFQIDKQWKIAVNGHQEPMACSLTSVPIKPFHCYVEYNGWPAGILTPVGGTIAAGSCANENTFIAAMQKRLQEAQNKTH